METMIKTKYESKKFTRISQKTEENYPHSSERLIPNLWIICKGSLVRASGKPVHLIQEMWDNNFNPEYDPYVYKAHCVPAVTDAKNILNLQQIKTMEGQAEFIEDLVRTYYNLTPFEY
jgi:hypothetical protein